MHTERLTQTHTLPLAVWPQALTGCGPAACCAGSGASCGRAAPRRWSRLREGRGRGPVSIGGTSRRNTQPLARELGGGSEGPSWALTLPRSLPPAAPEPRPDLRRRGPRRPEGHTGLSRRHPGHWAAFAVCTRSLSGNTHCTGHHPLPSCRRLGPPPPGHQEWAPCFLPIPPLAGGVLGGELWGGLLGREHFRDGGDSPRLSPGRRHGLGASGLPRVHPSPRGPGTHRGCGRPPGGSRCSCGPGPGSGSGRSSRSWAGAWPRRTLQERGDSQRLHRPTCAGLLWQNMLWGRNPRCKQGPDTLESQGRNHSHVAHVSTLPRVGHSGPEATPPASPPARPVPQPPPGTCHGGGAHYGDLCLTGLQVGGDVAHDHVHGLDQAQHHGVVLATTGESSLRILGPHIMLTRVSVDMGPREET